MKTLMQEEAGQLLLDNLYKQFGLLDKMLLDRGPQFAAMAFRELLKLLGIKSNLTTAYHPQPGNRGLSIDLLLSSPYRMEKLIVNLRVYP